MFEGNTVIVREIPQTCGREELIQFFKNKNLNIKHQYFEPVNENKRFQRNALITFASVDEVKDVVTNLDDREVNKDYLLYVKATPSPIRPIKKRTPFISSTDSRIQQDLSLAKQLIDVYDNYYNLTRPALFDNYTEVLFLFLLLSLITAPFLLSPTFFFLSSAAFFPSRLIFPHFCESLDCE